MKKINLVIGISFIPEIVDDPEVCHQGALLIEDENRNYRIILGINRDDGLSKPYMPYWHRTLSLEKLIYLRDQLTIMINKMNNEFNDKESIKILEESMYSEKICPWISVKDRLPENDIYVLAALKERHPVVAAYLTHSKIWINTNGSEVTHWMLLPEGP